MSTPRTRRLFDTDPNVLSLGPWIDPTLEQYGFAVDGEYVETFWLGTLGPTATWLLRRLVHALRTSNATSDVGATIRLDTRELAAALGIGSPNGHVMPLAKALERLLMFGVAQIRGHKLVVRCFLPPLAARQIDRLPPHLARSHSDWVSGRTDPALPLAPTINRDRSAA